MRAIVTVALAAWAAPALAADFSNADAAMTAAEKRVSAYFQLQGGYSWFDDTRGDFEESHFDAAARLNLWLAPSMSVQVDGWAETLSFGDYYGVAGHWSWRDPSRYLVGGLVSYGEAFNDKYVNFALEAQRYFGDLTVYAQGGYGMGTGQDDDQSMPYAQLIARYFLSPDCLVEAEAGYGRFDRTGLSSDVVRWQLKAEAKLPRAPLSAYVAYQGSRSDRSDGVLRIDHAVVAGLTLRSDATLQDTDRTGATLVDANPLFGVPEWR